MSNPTSNFNWQMPTATDLVTDLPADFEVFGQAVDSSMADLLGGTTGQILAKNSNTNMDFVWITNDVGDITEVAAGTGISGGGTSGAVTITNSMATEIAAAGDMIIGTGSATFDNLPIGTTGQILTADTTVSPYKVKWATPATASFVGVGVKKSANQSIANATFTAITFNQEDFDTNAFHDTSTNNTRITIPAGKAGYYAIAGTIIWSGNGVGNRGIELQKNGASVTYMNFLSAAASPNDGGYSMSYILNLAVSDYVELFGYQTSGGALNINSAGTNWQMQYLGA
jgi:hypothetical protein